MGITGDASASRAADLSSSVPHAFLAYIRPCELIRFLTSLFECVTTAMFVSQCPSAITFISPTCMLVFTFHLPCTDVL